MDHIFDPTRLKRAAPVAALACGAAFALLLAVLPQWRLEAYVSGSGLGGIVVAARPPLGATARSALALAGGGLVAALVWAALTFVTRLRPPRDDLAVADAPVLRRADAHPDAPARRPLRASEDLGETWGRPLPIGPVAAVATPTEEPATPASPRDLPVDLDTPLAAVDPGAIPAVPREPVRPVAPLARPEVAEEPIETFELTPIRRSPPAAPAPLAASTLSSLLDRLEQGAAQRGTKPAPLLDDALGMLRGLAAR